jgi:outer membrane receptor protein involved in Fe transport
LNRARWLMNDFMGAIGQLELRFTTPSINGPYQSAAERRIYRNDELDLFFTDTWRVRPNLTLNLGVRYEWAGVPIETQGLSLLPQGNGIDAVFGISGQAGLFNPGTFQGSPCALLRSLPMAVTTANATSFINNCSTPNVPARWHKRRFSGRSGFSWTSISRSARASRKRPTSNFAGRFSIFSIT